MPFSFHNPSIKKLLGFLLIFSALLFLLTLWSAESMNQEYSIFSNYISDLGVGETAFLFNNTLMLSGILIIFFSFILFKLFHSKLFSFIFALSGIGTLGVGLFPENVLLFHELFSAMAFFFGALTAIFSSKFSKKPWNYFFILLGVISIIAIIFFLSNINFGLGIGIIERAILYPFIVWILFFGIYLIFSKN